MHPNPQPPFGPGTSSLLLGRSDRVPSLLSAAARRLFNSLGHIDFWPPQKTAFPCISQKSPCKRELDSGQRWSSAAVVRSCQPNGPFAELGWFSRTSIAIETRDKHRAQVLSAQRLRQSAQLPR